MTPIRGWRDGAFRLGVVIWFLVMFAGIAKVAWMLIVPVMKNCGCSR